MVVLMMGISCILFFYIIILRKQIKNMNEVLVKRIERQTQQVMSLELVDKQLNALAENINVSLKAEESLRLKIIRDEEDFKQLIANISHDLRTPLTAIKGYLQMLDKSQLDDKQQEKLDKARKHVQSLGELIEHFFEYAYLVDSKPPIHLEKINLTNITIEEVAVSIPVLDEKNIEIFIEEQPVFVQGDKEMVKRIIQNLLRNCMVHAIEYIDISYTFGDEVVMHVKNPVQKDHAIDVMRLFERFYVGDGSRQTTGLGLAIVKLFAEQMGGRVCASIEDRILDIQVFFPEHNDSVNE